MNRPAPRNPRFFRAALLILLLLAQGVAVAHEFEHWGQPAQELCATCSLTSGLDAPVASDPAVLELSFQPAIQPACRASHVKKTHARHYQQRAPPFDL